MSGGIGATNACTGPYGPDFERSMEGGALKDDRPRCKARLGRKPNRTVCCLDAELNILSISLNTLQVFKQLGPPGEKCGLDVRMGD